MQVAQTIIESLNVEFCHAGSKQFNLGTATNRAAEQQSSSNAMHTGRLHVRLRDAPKGLSLSPTALGAYDRRTQVVLVHSTSSLLLYTVHDKES